MKFEGHDYPPKCRTCGVFIGADGEVTTEVIVPQDYWNGPDERIEAYCGKHKHQSKEPNPDA